MTSHLQRIGTAVGAIVLFFAMVSAASAQNYPVRPIHLVSPFPPSGGNDIISRALANGLSKHISQGVIVDNRPGAETVVGMSMVAKAPPDGYTLIMTSSTYAINPTLNPGLAYTVKDFEPVSLIGSTPLILTTNPVLPVSSVADVIALAKAKPGQVFAGSASLASRLAIELLNMMANVKIVHVPYKGTALAATDLMGNRVHLMFASAPGVLPHIKTGKLRGIALTSSARSQVMPDFPTVAESKLPDFEASTWYGVLVPAGTPPDIVRRLASEIVKALAEPEVRERLIAQGIDVAGTTPDQFKSYLQSEIVKWAKVIKFADVRSE